MTRWDFNGYVLSQESRFSEQELVEPRWTCKRCREPFAAGYGNRWRMLCSVRLSVAVTSEAKVRAPAGTTCMRPR